jgi:lycopene cyclase domain-containing protein
MAEYTVAAVAAAAAVVAIELAVLRTGLFRQRAYWATMAIVFGFQVLVDGWLTKASAPIVLYADDHTTGLRAPWDIPVEDFVYGFALLTLVLLLWVRAGAADRPPATEGR